MPKTCAYCGREGSLSKEHVWPDCFLSREGRTAAHFSHQSKRVHKGDYVVKDVCTRCNNDLLSPLDAYFCELYDRYFSKFEDFDATVHFEYDFELLARVLFKIAYNSARSADSYYRPIHRLVPGILGDSPMRGRCSLLAELVKPLLVPDAEASEGTRKVLPELHRSALTRLTTPNGSRIHSRMVAVNSYYFHLLVPRFAGDDEILTVVAEEVEEHVHGTILLPPDASSVVLKSSEQDGTSSIFPHMLENLDEYRRFFSR
jgi:hypothetical protein